MNKVLKLGLSKNLDDRKIAQVLYKKDQKRLGKHFFNIALYLGPRTSSYTHEMFKAVSETNHLYVVTHNFLSPYLDRKLWKTWDKDDSMGNAKGKEGLYFEEAKKSLEILLNE